VTVRGQLGDLANAGSASLAASLAAPSPSRSPSGCHRDKYDRHDIEASVRNADTKVKARAGSPDRRTGDGINFATRVPLPQRSPLGSFASPRQAPPR
jgi:hypothetical protein